MSETIKERKLEIMIGLFLLGGIIAWLIIPTSFQDTTIILEGGGGGAPVSCLPSGGLVLAQNLTDLCDVTIISPTTNQIIKYNGSQWINVAQTTFNDTTTCNNIGVGNAFVCVEGTNVNLRSILNGTGIIVNNDTNTITITNSLPDNTACANVGTGSNVYKDGECNFRSILGSADISVTQQTNTITIDYNGTYVRQVDTIIIDTTLTDQDDMIICDTNSGAITLTLPNSMQGKQYTVKTPDIPSSNPCTLEISGAGTFDDGNDFIILDKDWESVTVIGVSAGIWRGISTQAECDNLGSVGVGICSSDTDIPLVKFQKLLAGTSISLSSNGTRITITNDAPDNTVCANVGSGTVIYKDGECNFKTLVGSPDISITNTTDTVVIDYNGTHVTSLTSADTATLSFNASSGNVLATPTLKKLCEFTGVGGETSITCTFSSSQQVFYAQVHFNSTVTNTQWALRFNNDTGANYAVRSASNGGADASSTGRTSFFSNTITASVMNSYMIECHDHMNTFEKWCNGDITTMVSGAGTAPARTELYGKWANRTADITSINLTRIASTGTLNAGSHIIVWGYS